MAQTLAGDLQPAPKQSLITHTVRELAEMLKLSESTITRMFQDELGVLKLNHQRLRGSARPHITLRIPRPVAERKLRELAGEAFDAPLRRLPTRRPVRGRQSRALARPPALPRPVSGATAGNPGEIAGENMRAVECSGVPRLDPDELDPRQCGRCGMVGQHPNPDACIGALRDQLAIAQLKVSAEHGKVWKERADKRRQAAALPVVQA